MSEQLTFDAVASAAARDRSLQQVDDAAAELWKAAADRAVALCARELPGGFTSDDVVRRIPVEVDTHEPRALGPVMLRAQKRGLVEPTGEFRASARVSAHRNPKRVWRRAR